MTGKIESLLNAYTTAELAARTADTDTIPERETDALVHADIALRDALRRAEAVIEAARGTLCGSCTCGPCSRLRDALKAFDAEGGP